MVLDRSKRARLTPQSDKRRYLEAAPNLNMQERESHEQSSDSMA